ncbi:MAG TPA: O-methyltransferase, partial [Caulobacteraceae bacterium]|nr:O-methyltransferase [Caulobacteraceae bacterium]
KDSSWMVTVGGFFGSSSKSTKFNRLIKKRLPILGKPDGDNFFEISDWNVTDKERRIFDRAATSQNYQAEYLPELKKLGFKEAEIDAYRQLIRYFPRYYEAFV